jgi:prolyl-tRNA synthetase
MRLSQSFARPTKSVADYDTANARLLVQAGFVDQLMAGVYSYLPLGLRVLRRIEQVVREEMNAIGGQEVLMPGLHPKANWETTGGWDSIDVLFHVKSRTGNDYALGQSAEEVVTPLVMSRAVSYRDLPLSVYQFSWKFRDELRAKSGILRGREFLMKDMYSFHTTQQDFLDYYEQVKQAYLRVFDRLGLVAKVTEASGGNFTDKVSYEFEVLTDAGEDVIYYCTSCDFCVEDEIATVKPGDKCPHCGKSELLSGKAAEVGNVFDLGQKYGRDFDLPFVDATNTRQYPFMGCYGIGISRVMGVLVEKYNDERGILWPYSVAPFAVHLVRLGEDQAVADSADQLYAELQDAGVEVLYDDRSEGAGAKFANADLIGCPTRLTISARTMEHQQLEYKDRDQSESRMIPRADVLAELGRGVIMPKANHKHK